MVNVTVAQLPGHKVLQPGHVHYYIWARAPAAPPPCRRHWHAGLLTVTVGLYWTFVNTKLDDLLLV